MGDTTISWTARPGTRGRTWNPTSGCEMKSEGCRNCYAMRQARRFAGPGKPFDGLVNLKTGKWSGEHRFNLHKLTDPLAWRDPSTVFVDSMSDLFWEAFSNEEIAAVFGVMAATPQHTYQILTKRPDRMLQWFHWVAQQRTPLQTIPYSPKLTCIDYANQIFGSMEGLLANGCKRQLSCPSPREWPLPNVWLGVSVENQAAADERIDHLLDTPAAIRFLSAEPLLGPLDLEPWLARRIEVTHDMADAPIGAVVHGMERVGSYWWRREHLHWIIGGAESGPGARACKTEWLRELRDQCEAHRVAYWLKQAVWDPAEDKNGQPAVHSICMTSALTDCDDEKCVAITTHPKSKGRGFGGTMIERPYLDGKQHLEFPDAA